MSTAPATHHRSRLYRSLAVAGMLVVAILATVLADRLFFADPSPGAGSGDAATQSRSLPAFTAVDLAGANNVIVQVGGRQSVVVHADKNLLGRVETSVRAGTLVIDTTHGDLAPKSPMFVVVRAPSLSGLTLEGAGNISASGIENRRFTVAMPGSGTIEATGTTNTLALTLPGQGTALLRGLVARDADVTLGGDGTIMVTATRSLTARVTGTGAIVYGGNPSQVARKVTGTGTISAG